MALFDALKFFAENVVYFVGPPMGAILDRLNNYMIDNDIDKKVVMKYLPLVLLIFYACLVVVLLIACRYQLFSRIPKKRPRTTKKIGANSTPIQEEAKDANKLVESTTTTLEQKKNE